MKKWRILALLLAVAFCLQGIAFAADTPEKGYANYQKSIKSAAKLDDITKYVCKDQVEALNKMSKEKRDSILPTLKQFAPIS